MPEVHVLPICCENPLEKSDAARSMPRTGRECGGDKRGQHCAGRRAYGVSETCSHYSPKRDEENEVIADLLVGLTDVHKT